MDDIKAVIEKYIIDKKYSNYFSNVRVEDNGSKYTVKIDYDNLPTNKLIKAMNIDKERKFTTINYSSNEIFIDVISTFGNPGLKEVTNFLYFTMLP